MFFFWFFNQIEKKLTTFNPIAIPVFIKQSVMKKIIICVLLVILSVASFSQQTTAVSPILTKTDYLKKSKNQKTAAWILLGGGITTSIIGLTQINLAGSDENINNGLGTALFITGSAAAISSIFFFSASKKNKRKAMSLSFKLQQMPQLQQTSIGYYPIPSLKLKISL